MATTGGGALHVYLDRQSHDAIQTVAEETGCSITALFEALGRSWADQLTAGVDADEIAKDLIRPARRIDAARRRRGGAR